MNPSAIPQFVRQADQPLYPAILYNRPVTRHAAGRLLVVGGHTGEFSLPTQLNQLALAAGLGECVTAMPDALLKFLGGAPGVSFVPSSPSGSLDPAALSQILYLSEEADAVAVGASLSNNSQTAILTERLVAEVERPVVLFGDAFVALQHYVPQIAARPDTLLIMTMPEIFKLAGTLGILIRIRRDGGLINKLEIVRDVAAAVAGQIVVYGSEIIVSAGDEAVVTPVNYRLSLVPAAYYAVLATLWLQNPTRRRQGLATGAYLLGRLSLTLADDHPPTTTQLGAAMGKLLNQDFA